MVRLIYIAMRIERFKRWFQCKNEEGHTVAQFLTENEARVFCGMSTMLPCADVRMGEEPVCRRRGFVMRKIRVYP